MAMQQHTPTGGRSDTKVEVRRISYADVLKGRPAMLVGYVSPCG